MQVKDINIWHWFPYKLFPLYHTEVSLRQWSNSKFIKRSERGQAPLGSSQLHSQEITSLERHSLNWKKKNTGKKK